MQFQEDIPVAGFDTGDDVIRGGVVEEDELAPRRQCRWPMIHLPQQVAHECLLPPATYEHHLHHMQNFYQSKDLPSNKKCSCLLCFRRTK